MRMKLWQRWSSGRQVQVMTKLWSRSSRTAVGVVDDLGSVATVLAGKTVVGDGPTVSSGGGGAMAALGKTKIGRRRIRKGYNGCANGGRWRERWAA